MISSKRALLDELEAQVIAAENRWDLARSFAERFRREYQELLVAVSDLRTGRTKSP